MTNRLARKQTIINLLSNLFSYAVSIGISFLLTPFLIDKIGKETYSFYPIANTYLNYMIIVTSGLNTIASRFITINIAKNEENEAKRFFKASFLSESIVSVSLLIPMVLIIFFVDKFMDVPTNSLLAIRVLFATIFASGLVNIISSILGVATFSKNRIDLRSYRELFASLLKAILCIFAYVVFPASIAYIGIIALSIALFNVVVQFIFTKKLLPGFLFNKEKVSKEHIRILLKSSVWTIVLSLGNMILGGMAIVYANIFYGASESGMVSIVQTIPSFLSGIITVLVGVFYPQLSYAVASQDTDKIKNIVIKTEKIVGGFGVSVIAVFGAVSTSFYSLWVPNENTIELCNLSFLVMGYYFAISIFYVLNYLFISLNKVKIPALFTVGFGILYFLLCLIMYFIGLPYWSILLNSFIVQTLWVGVFMPIYAHKLIGIEYKKMYFPALKCLILLVLIFAFCFAVTNIFIINSWIKFIIYALLAGGTSLIVSYYFLDNKLFIDIFKSCVTNFKKVLKKGKKR